LSHFSAAALFPLVFFIVVLIIFLRLVAFVTVISFVRCVNSPLLIRDLHRVFTGIAGDPFGFFELFKDVVK
jgi:hypothetical protein